MTSNEFHALRPGDRVICMKGYGGIPAGALFRLSELFRFRSYMIAELDFIPVCAERTSGKTSVFSRVILSHFECVKQRRPS